MTASSGLIGVFVIGIAGVVLTFHVAGRPPLARRFPVTFWFVDLVLVPVAALLGAELLSRTGLGRDVAEPGTVLNAVAVGLFLAAAVWHITRGVELLLWRGSFAERGTSAAPALLKALTYGCLTVAAVALFLWWIGHPVTGFLVSTGVLAAILGLALQSTLSDLFSGIAISIERPFHLGDWIQLQDGTVGQVVDLTWRSTRLKTFNNTILSVPNAVLAAQAVVNLDQPSGPYSVWYSIRISSEVEPRLAVTLLAAAVGNCRHVLSHPTPTVRLSDAQESPYTYRVWVHYRSYLAHFKGQDELFSEIHAALRDAQVRPAAPQHHLKVERARPLSPLAPNIASTLRSTELLGELGDEAIAELAAGSRYEFVEEGRLLVREGDDMTKILIVVTGALTGSVESSAGRSAEVVRLAPGESVGWFGMVCGEKAFMSVSAAEDSFVVFVDGSCLATVLNNNPWLKPRLADLVARRRERSGALRAGGAQQAERVRTPDDILRRIERFLSRSSEA